MVPQLGSDVVAVSRCGALTYDGVLDVWFMPNLKTWPKATSWGLPNGLVKVDLDFGSMVW